MNDISNNELKKNVIKYYENDDHPFSYIIAGHLDCKSDIDQDWNSLYKAYIRGEFTPADCRFMYGCNVVLVETCPKCDTELEDAPGIGPYCPNKDCDVIDNINGWDKPKPVYDFSQPVSESDRKKVALECVDVIMNNTDRHRKEYFAQLLRDYFGLNE